MRSSSLSPGDCLEGGQRRRGDKQRVEEPWTELTLCYQSQEGSRVAGLKGRRDMGMDERAMVTAGRARRAVLGQGVGQKVRQANRLLEPRCSGEQTYVHAKCIGIAYAEVRCTRPLVLVKRRRQPCFRKPAGPGVRLRATSMDWMDWARWTGGKGE